MNEYVAPLRDMRFILSSLAGIDEIGRLPGYEETTPDLVDAILEEAGKFSSGVLSPLNPVGDAEGCRVENGVVRTATGWSEVYAQFRDAGWVGLAMPAQYGGQGLPKAVAAPVNEMWFAANLAFSLLPPMAVGSVDTLMRAASDDLKACYIPRMVSGEWTATMDLTEPNAGSDLGAIQTRAESHADGSYRLFGQKIFITYGDHDLAENIVHLVLARMSGAPAGVRGISMFLVPKYLVNADGTLGARNDMHCISVEHKLGIHGSPTCTMSYGDAGGAVGYLVGEPGRGLEYMFVMVNESRFNVGLQGIALGDRAYQKALTYARERTQGRDAITGEANVPIIRHPDVKRMLLVMRASVMATRMLAYVAAGWFDKARHHPDEVTVAQCRSLVDLLMPVVKGWSTELGIEVANMGIQIHGGMGFIEETGVAQYLRDVRITAIYEGTTGIQANDLISRKILRDGGAALGLLIAEIRSSSHQALEDGRTTSLGRELERSLALLEDARDWILSHESDTIGELLAGGTSFLRMLGTICGAWQMTRAALVAQNTIDEGQGDVVYLQGIIELARFYFAQLLPQVAMHMEMLNRAGPAVLQFPDTAL
ncbi:acyl-CoA dehydrogenase [Noviherbaspirillum sp. Root189]|uniref:acyl-CoA dehydrogenase n=1 Tax=Noviherbaspirillum sp. Root189 TaxID=1736487 RepID=UPI000708F457|nr:acyl-CoA dehydrogenase [Noviherbaspirillum sp. Root189]KRB70607.1 acyl-CoA dehydrogenase [Noviherbaspirillum sp. Root189]